MNVLVLYQSRNGHTRAAAEGIAEAARDLKHNVTIKSVIEASPVDIERADALFVGTWVQGFILFGVKPAGADLWVSALPPLKDKPVGVFCTYAVNPRGSLKALSDRLVDREARVVGQHAFQRSRVADGTISFVADVLKAAGRRPI